MFNPTPMNAPLIHCAPWNIRMKTRPQIGSINHPKINAKCLKEAFRVVLGKSEMFFETPINSCVCEVVYRDAIRFLACKGSQDAFL